MHNVGHTTWIIVELWAVKFGLEIKGIQKLVLEIKPSRTRYRKWVLRRSRIGVHLTLHPHIYRILLDVQKMLVNLEWEKGKREQRST